MLQTCRHVYWQHIADLKNKLSRGYTCMWFGGVNIFT